MITVDANSVELSVDREGSQPNVELVRKIDGSLWAFLHLTRRRYEVLNGKTGKDVAAIVITGSVDVQRDARDSLNSWKFRFIQVARTKAYQWVFAGRQETEGSSMINFAVPPNVPGELAYSFLLDSEQPNIPFTSAYEPTVSESPRGQSRVTVNVTTETTDHPSSLIPIRLKNRVTNADNFLVRAIRDIDVVTAFVAVNETGSIQVLAHVAWRANWMAFIDWQGDVGAPFIKGSKLTVDSPQKGPPIDREIAALIANPPRDPDKCYNKVFDRARASAVSLGINVAPFASTESGHRPPGTRDGPIVPHL